MTHKHDFQFKVKVTNMLSSSYLETVVGSIFYIAYFLKNLFTLIKMTNLCMTNGRREKICMCIEFINIFFTSINFKWEANIPTPEIKDNLTLMIKSLNFSFTVKKVVFNS